MPRGVSTPWKIDPATGAVLPYYEGSFNVRGDLGNNSLGIDSEQVSAGQRTIDLYQPERLIFKRQALGDAGGTTAPGDEVGAIWAQYPDPLAIPADMNADASYSRVMVAAGAPGIGGRRGAFRKLLGSDGTSDFVQKSDPAGMKVLVSPAYLAPVGTNPWKFAFTSGVTAWAQWTITLPPGSWSVQGVATLIGGGYSNDSSGITQRPALATYINGSTVGYGQYFIDVNGVPPGSTGWNPKTLTFPFGPSGPYSGTINVSIREYNSAGDGTGSTSINMSNTGMAGGLILGYS